MLIHDRDAHDEVLAAVRAVPGSRGVMHCFSGDAAFARRCAGEGFIASFSGIVTFPRSDGIQDAARTVADDGYVVETNSPFLSPVPERGKPNLPERVAITAAAVARLRGESDGGRPCRDHAHGASRARDRRTRRRPRRVPEDARAERARRPLDLTDPRTLTAVGRRVGLRRDTSLGQHFLIDRDVLDAIVDALDPAPDSEVLEIGCGLGTLTGALAARAGRVVAIDVDPACVAGTAITQQRQRQRHRARGRRTESSIPRRSASPPGGWRPATCRTS